MEDVFELDFNDDEKRNSSVAQNWDELLNGKTNRSILTLQKQHGLASQVQQMLASDWISLFWPTVILKRYYFFVAI